MRWNRIRFKTKLVDDFRPIEWPMAGPYWCTGYDESHAALIVYLPEGIPITKYWPDAFDIEMKTKNKITYTDRFPKPDWWSGE